MANTTLTQTGAQVQAILDKADKLPSTLGTAGQVLTMNAGATAPEWQTPSAPHFHMSWTSPFNGVFLLHLIDGTTISSLQADYRDTFDVVAIEMKINDPTNDMVQIGDIGTTLCFAKTSDSPGHKIYNVSYAFRGLFDTTPMSSFYPDPDAAYNVMLVPITSADITNFTIYYD